MRVACVMMQKDEDLLLEPWLRLYGYIFGFENLYVFDNGSTNPEVQNTLARFSGAGVHVFYDRNRPKDFDDKGLVVTSIIKSFQTNDLYDFVLPLDCDEFIVCASPSGFSINRSTIWTELLRLNIRSAMGNIAHCLENRPGYLDLFRLTSFSKSLIPVRDFKSVDHGFHEAQGMKNGTDRQRTSLIYAHLHFKPFELVRRHALEKLAPFVDINDRESILRFKGVGRHLVRFFTMDEHDYYSTLGLDSEYPYPLIRYNGLLNFLRLLMPLEYFERIWTTRPHYDGEHVAPSHFTIDLSEQFDTASYLLANPDVARSNMNPLIHYALFGSREGRPLRPKSAPPNLSTDGIAE